eukprot:6179802-Pleurochrysis_carterae.AAC.1
MKTSAAEMSVSRERSCTFIEMPRSAASASTGSRAMLPERALETGGVSSCAANQGKGCAHW